MNKTDFSDFPSTRYYGSKRRLLPWISKVASEFDFDSVFDRFGGTASVSLLFQRMGKEVIFHDALQFNTISAKALLSSEFFDKKLILAFFKDIKPLKGFISENFDGTYYSDEENQWLDGVAHKIHNTNNDPLKDFYWYCLFQACLKKRPFNTFHRANYYLRTANVHRNFGNLTTWNKSFLDHIQVASQELEKNFMNENNTNTNHKILPAQDFSTAEIDADLIYLDPPYLSNNSSSDDYFKRYHFLEGLIQYDNWANLINSKLKTKAIPTPSHIKEWNSKAVFKKLLFSEIKKYSNKKVMLSYQTNGYPHIDSIYDFFVENFSAVHIYKMPLSHALAKTTKTEVLIIGVP